MVDGFSLSEISAYSEVAQVTYAYILVIITLLASAALSVFGGARFVSLIFGLVAVPLVYEVYRIVGMLLAYGSVDPELFNAHIGIRLILFAVVASCIINTVYLRNSFNKKTQPTANASAG